MAEVRQPTIRDVATAAGCAVSTVSNVLNAHPHVREETRRRVLAAVDELGYRPSRAARSLPGGRTFLLAYCLPGGDTPNSALDVFLHQVVETAAEADLEMLLVTQRGESVVEPYAGILRRGGADGFVLSGIDYDDERVTFLRERNIPFGCFGRVNDPEISWVDVDGAAGVAAAVDHVAALGHDRLAFVGWPEGSSTGDDRYRGFVDACEAGDLAPTSVDRVVNGFEHGRNLVPELLRNDPTAIVCVSDALALGVMAGLRDAGVEPGRDIVVTGFDDVPAAALTAPGLTSVRQPMDEVGRLLVERLVARLTGATVPPPALVQPELIVRESTKRADG